MVANLACHTLPLPRRLQKLMKISWVTLDRICDEERLSEGELGWLAERSRTAVSMLDRLLHHCHVVVTNGDSYRMKQARARGGDTRKPS